MTSLHLMYIHDARWTQKPLPNYNKNHIKSQSGLLMTSDFHLFSYSGFSITLRLLCPGRSLKHSDWWCYKLYIMLIIFLANLHFIFFCVVYSVHVDFCFAWMQILIIVSFRKCWYHGPIRGCPPRFTTAENRRKTQIYREDRNQNVNFPRPSVGLPHP